MECAGNSVPGRVKNVAEILTKGEQLGPARHHRSPETSEQALPFLANRRLTMTEDRSEQEKGGCPPPGLFRGARGSMPGSVLPPWWAVKPFSPSPPGMNSKHKGFEVENSGLF